MISITIKSDEELNKLQRMIEDRLKVANGLVDRLMAKPVHSSTIGDTLDLLGIRTKKTWAAIAHHSNLSSAWIDVFALDDVLDEIKAFRATGMCVSDANLTLTFDSLDDLLGKNNEEKS